MRFIFQIIFLLAALAFCQESQQQSEANKRADLLGTVNVSKVSSLDDAKGTYKSPKKAMFMSLVLPGSGQFYVGGSQSRYIRGGFYLAEEIALISGLYYHSIYKYDNQVKKYRGFANSHFSVSQYESAMNSILSSGYGSSGYKENFERLYGSEQENYCKAFFNKDDVVQSCKNAFGESSNTRPNSNTPLYNNSEYYRVIANDNFILGWDDAIANNSAVVNLINQEYPEWASLGESENYSKYLSMRKKANDYADRQAIFLGAIILNHIISAIDAALSARAHNNSLYEEKISFLDRIRPSSELSLGEDFRVGVGLWYYF